MTGESVLMTDEVLEDISTHIAGHEPERGGALLGPVGVRAVTRFLPDPEATVTSASYRSSAGLGELVRAAEAADPLIEFKGIVHSHPGSFDRPSSQDEIAFADSLTLNPWMMSFMAPIVIRHRPWRDAGIDRARLGDDGWMTVWEAEADQTGPSKPAPLRTLPIRRDLEAVVAAGLATEPTAIGLIDGGTGAQLAATIQTPSGPVVLLFPWDYPEQAPVAFVSSTRMDDEPDDISPTDLRPVPLPWDAAAPHGERLTAALATALPASAAPGEAPGSARDESAVHAEASSSGAADAGDGGRFARLGGIVPEGLSSARVLVVGVGSVGSHLAELLARSGVGGLNLVDPDVVEAANLSRCVFTTDDLGRAKVEALAARLVAIDPGIDVVTRQESVCDLTAGELSDLITAADLVVAATDDPAAQLRLNHHAMALGVAALFPAVYARGHGGEVVVTVPGVTPCFRCATVGRAARTARPETSYGTGRLVAEPALGADVLHVTTAAAKLALAVLAAGETSCDLGTFLVDGLQVGSYLLMSTVAGFDFFPQVFHGVAGQFAYQAVWLQPTRSPTCAVCGDDPHRYDPGQLGGAQPRLDHLTLLGGAEESAEISQESVSQGQTAAALQS